MGGGFGGGGFDPLGGNDYGAGFMGEDTGAKGSDKKVNRIYNIIWLFP